VKRGGHVLGFAKLAMLDGQGWSWRRRPGGGLDTVFGARERRIDVEPGPIAITVPVSGWLPGFEGGTVTGTWHRQALETTTGEVVGRFADGSPALTRCEHGAGTAWLAGSHLDVAVRRHGDPATTQLLRSIARATAGEPLWSAELSDDGLPRVWARLRSRGDEGILAVTSTAAHASSLTVSVRARTATDLLTDEAIVVNAHGFSVPVEPMGSRLIKLEGIDA
jgi:hypothetical protein